MDREHDCHLTAPTSRSLICYNCNGSNNNTPEDNQSQRMKAVTTQTSISLFNLHNRSPQGVDGRKKKFHEFHGKETTFILNVSIPEHSQL